MQKFIIAIIFLLLPLISVVSFAGASLDKAFAVTVMDNGNEMCKLSFKTESGKLMVSVNGNGEDTCKVKEDVENGFTGKAKIYRS